MKQIAQVVANLAAWLETMRAAPGSAAQGYGGPVVHWWQNCLSFTGAGLDWRYEGIISGYLTLWQRTGENRWLAPARCAGDELVKGQLPGGNFRDSTFELNPYPGGTPHEAAADLGLLRLALALRDVGNESAATPYAAAAMRNLEAYFLNRLWDPTAQSFRDHPDMPSLVPNKACTLVEALFAAACWQGTEEWITCYGLPTLESVLQLQVMAPGWLYGAIAQNQIRGQVVEAYFPYYNARCIPALRLAYDHTGQEHWLASAAAALAFIQYHLDDEGRLPQVVYRRDLNRYPQWIAPLGDVLRAADLLAPYGVSFTGEPVVAALLAGQQPGGGIVTGRGFGSQISQRFRSQAEPDFRDCIPVAGWADKAFAYLAGRVPPDQPLPPPQLQPVKQPCRLRHRAAIWQETETRMSLLANGQTLYHWQKGQPWAAVVAPEVMWK